MRPLFVLGPIAAGALAAIGAASLKPDPGALPLRMPDAVLTAEADSGPWRNAGLTGGEAGAFGNAMMGGAEGFTLVASAPGGEKALIHVVPAPQGGLILLSEGGRWTYVGAPDALRPALDALASAGRPVDL